MSHTEKYDLNTVNSSSQAGDFWTSENLTEQCLSSPIKILLFPPKNKQFRFDEENNSIGIEPLHQVASSEKLSPNETTLTPLVENCKLVSSTPKSESGGFIDSNLAPDFDGLQITEICKVEKVFKKSKLKENCFLKGCKWSGDGLCLLSNSEDHILRLFEINGNVINEPKNDLEPVLQIKEGGVVYDYAWYPKMNSSDPISCVFASSSQDSPIHLWDAYTGQLCATYQPINQYDEVTSAYSLAFTPDGTRLYSGFKKCLRIFDISQPGRISEDRNLKNKGNPFQSNIISSICINPIMPTLYALGSYDKTIGIYTEPDGELLCILKGHSGGVTQVIFSADGNYLFSGGRKDNEILCWDVRNPGKVVFSVERKVDTQQKMLFDLSLAPDQTYLITGTTDCNIRMYNIKTQNDKVLKPTCCFKAHEDCVNAAQFHPIHPLFASSSGQRHLPPPPDEENDGIGYRNGAIVDNSIKICLLGSMRAPVQSAWTWKQVQVLCLCLSPTRRFMFQACPPSQLIGHQWEVPRPLAISKTAV